MSCAISFFFLIFFFINTFNFCCLLSYTLPSNFYFYFCSFRVIQCVIFIWTWFWTNGYFCQISKIHIKKFASFYGFSDNQNASARLHTLLPIFVISLFACLASDRWACLCFMSLKRTDCDVTIILLQWEIHINPTILSLFNWMYILYNMYFLLFSLCRLNRRRLETFQAFYLFQ